MPHRRAWLLAIGRRLRADYDATAEPLPARLAELVKQLEMPAEKSTDNGETPPLVARISDNDP
jgi:anti-sigma factor NepR-like protein